MKNNDNLSCFIFSFLFVHIIILFALIQEFQIFSIVSSISLIIINNNTIIIIIIIIIAITLFSRHQKFTLIVLKRDRNPEGFRLLLTKNVIAHWRGDISVKHI